MKENYWKGKNFAYFSHTTCEYFPCHNNADSANFNCLFCYCPLYTLGDKCGGNYVIMENGIKDCSRCLFPHNKENYGKIMEKLSTLENKEKK